jgi:microcystin degradation protein MlrC
MTTTNATQRKVRTTLRTPLRIAFARINQETNALSPVETTLDDFRATHFYEGDALLQRTQKYFVTEVESMFRNAELSGFVQQCKKLRDDVQPVPLLSAWAVPAGPLTRACFDELVRMLCDSLRDAHEHGGVDAVYLSLHGAMNVRDLPLDEHETPESEIVRRVREVVGDDVPVGVSLDLHGQICRGLLARSTIVQAYQTNPHRDHAAVGARMARLLADTARGRIVPVMAWRSLPMILGGGNTIDFLNPLRAIFQHMKALERDPRVLATSLMTVHPWNDHKHLGWATLVVTDAKRDPDAHFAEHCADDLATRAWSVREKLPPVFGGVDAAIARARKHRFRRRTGVIVMSDASDVVSAGAPGENTALIRALADATDLKSMATLRDPALVDTLTRDHKVGDDVDVVLGGKLHPEQSGPWATRARIVELRRVHGMGRLVVLAIASLQLVVVEGPALAVRPSYFKTAGLDPWKADVVVVKNFFPFLLFFAPLMRDVIFVKTGGVTDFDAAFGLSFANPVHPRDVVHDWRPTDAKRRGVRGH